MGFWAHSGSKDDHSDWQGLLEHLQGVAACAACAGRPLGIERATRLAGLLHDLGKYDPKFQRHIAGDRQRVDHSTAGGAVLLGAARGRDALAADLLAYVILGHHAGLPDKGPDGSDATVAARLDRLDPARLDPAWQDEVAIDLAGASDEVMAKVRCEGDGRGGLSAADRFDLSMVARMAFSCLIDADRRDTEAHYVRTGQEPPPDRDWRDLQAILPSLVDGFDAHMAKKPKDGDLNALRRDVLAHVRAKAAMRPGLFTLTVPTGGGKTLASLGFALDHARAHGLRRVVYAIPYTSIIDQTADEFRKVLGDGVVLEHHASLEDARDPARRSDEDSSRDKLRLAMEDWAAPVVVTTNVQLFESLFAARPSRARKLHNLAGSVIVLDEAQTIPRPLLEPCVRAIDTLARHWGCSVVLCTATQPAFQRGRLALPLDRDRELAPEPEDLARALRRTRIVRAGPMEDDALVAALAAERQALVIVNSRRHALDLYEAARHLEGVVHLTTRQCAAHRRKLLAEVRRMLLADEPCRVIATSLVEAGVDLDFPRVWRAEAGLDSIIREGVDRNAPDPATWLNRRVALPARAWIETRKRNVPSLQPGVVALPARAWIETARTRGSGGTS